MLQGLLHVLGSMLQGEPLHIRHRMVDKGSMYEPDSSMLQGPSHALL